MYYNMLGLDVSAETFFYIMISFSFFVGILLAISPEAFEIFNNTLQKEYGIKRHLWPKIEQTKIEIIDRALIKHCRPTGTVIAILSFFLLMIYK